MSDSEHFALPCPPKGGWIAMALVGALVLAPGAIELLSDHAAAAPQAFLMTGAGLFLLGFALLVLSSRQHAVALVLDDDALELRDNQGGSVAIPWAVIDRVTCVQSPNDGTVFALYKKDGGLLELAALRSRERGAELVQPIAEALARYQKAGRASETDGAAPFVLRHVTDKRNRRGRELSWRSGTPLLLVLPRIAPFVGMALVGLGFHRAEPNIGTMVFTGFALTMLFFAAVAWLAGFGARQVVEIGADTLRCERHRLLGAAKVDELPLEQVAAVDYAHQLNTAGANLTIRTRDAKTAATSAEKLARDAVKNESAVQGVRALASVMAALAGGVQLPLGKLPLSEKIALDLVLSTAIAEATGRSGDHL